MSESSSSSVQISTSFKTWWDGVNASLTTSNDDDCFKDESCSDDTQRPNSRSRRKRLLLPLLDLRSNEEYTERRLQWVGRISSTTTAATTATSSCRDSLVLVHIPWTELNSRAFELPPRNMEFALLLPNSFYPLLMPKTTTTMTTSKHQQQQHEEEEELLQQQQQQRQPQDDKIAQNNRLENTQIMEQEQLMFLQRWFPNVCSGSSSSSFLLSSSVTDNTKQLKQKHHQQQQHAPWNIPLVLLSCDQLWQEAREFDMFYSNNKQEYLPRKDENQNFISNATAPATPPAPRLWQPHPMVANHLLPLLQTNLTELLSQRQKHRNVEQNGDDSHGHADESNNKIGSFEIWDFGSGAGRDVCFLAESLLHSHPPSHHQQQQSQHQPQQLNVVTVCGMDHLLASANRCLPFWKRRHVESITCSLLLDLHQMAQVERVWNERTTTRSCRPPRQIMCCYAVRFYHRPLFEWLLQHLSSSEDKLCNRDNPSNNDTITRLSYTIPFVLAISHFCKPTPQATWSFDHPKESHVLERTELRKMIEKHEAQRSKNSSLKWIIIRDEIVPDGDHGRTLIEFIAQLQRR